LHSIGIILLEVGSIKQKRTFPTRRNEIMLVFFHHNSSLLLRYFSYLSSIEYAEQIRLQYEMKPFKTKFTDKEQSEQENH